MGKEIHNDTFNPEAIKDRLAEINEQEKEETFLCKGCLTDSTGYIYQGKLCKKCALKLIAYSRKAQNHIDMVRPAYKFDDNIKMTGIKRSESKYVTFLKEKKEATSRDFGKQFNADACSYVNRLVRQGVIEEARQQFVGNRIVKVYRIKGK